MRTAETPLIQPLINVLVEAHDYANAYDGDAPFELGDLKTGIRNSLTALAQEGTLDDKKIFLSQTLEQIPGINDRPELVSFLVRAMFDTHVVKKSFDRDEAPKLAQMKEMLAMRDFAMAKLSPHIQWLARQGIGLETDATTYITKEFCLVSNQEALLKDGNDVVLYDANKKPVKIDLSAKPDKDDYTLIVGQIFHKVASGQITPTECAREIVQTMEWPASDINAFNHT